MTDARRRRLFSAAAIGVLTLAAAPSARADCSSNVPGNHVFALGGDVCTASPGAYNPTTPIPVAPNNIVGFFAEDGGSIGASGAVSIAANPAAGSYAVWSDGGSDGGPSSINLAVPVTITTSGGNSYGFYATAGGTIDASDAPSVTTTGPSSIAVLASDAGSTITTSGAVIATSGLDAPGVVSASGGSVVLGGGSVTTSNDGSYGAAAFTGSSISVTGTMITTLGNVDEAGIQSVDVWIAGAGATGTLTNDTLASTGVQSGGVLAQAGGVATISGGTITVSGTNSLGCSRLGQAR